MDKEKYRNLKDQDGITMEKAFALCALDFNSIDEASRKNEEFKAFFELHIEQGPILINNEKKIGVVTGIAAPERFIFKIIGKASHSGTTPMNMRKDALLGASEIALALEKAAIREQENGTVATVGVINIQSGAMNVIPGEVEMKVDIRSTSLQSRNRVLDELHEVIASVKEKRQLDVQSLVISSEEPVLLDADVIDSLTKICEESGLPYELMPSGAGHDAMNMARLCPTGLIFIPSVDGLSHHPNEYTPMEDVLLGIDVLEQAVLHYAN